MGEPLEKVYDFFGFTVPVKQVLDVSVLKINKECLYFIPWPATESSFEDELSHIAEELPLSIRVTISDWYFIVTEANLSWQDYLVTLKPRHAKRFEDTARSPTSSTMLFGSQVCCMFPASLPPSPFIHFLSTRVTRDCEFRCQDLDPK